MRDEDENYDEENEEEEEEEEEEEGEGVEERMVMLFYEDRSCHDAYSTRRCSFSGKVMRGLGWVYGCWGWKVREDLKDDLEFAREDFLGRFKRFKENRLERFGSWVDVAGL
ncbi:hypothetical protein M0802_002340 [Mischocyttarus mexicanus]|nr:hypothetical protein M0802_002340 [Mischocyttarus mexicanus]